MSTYLLSQNEREILSQVQLRADDSFTTLGKLSGLKPHSVGRQINRLLERGLIRRYPIINHYLLGRHEVGIYINTNKADFDLNTDSVKGKLDAVTNLGGRFNYCLDVTASTPYDFYELSNSLRARNLSPLKQEIAIRLKRTILQRKYFSKRAPLPSYVTLAPAEKIEALDPIDSKLLDLLSAQPNVSLAHYGKQLGLTASAILYRINNLKSRKILLGWAFAILSLKLGIQTFRALIKVRSSSTQQRAALSKFLINDVAVVTITECLGSWDYELRVEGFSIDEIQKFRQRLSALSDGMLQEFELLPFMGTTRMSGFSP